MQPATDPDSTESRRLMNLYRVAYAMDRDGLPEDFIVEAVRTATDYTGVYDLMMMWGEEADEDECDEIVADIQDMIDACSDARDESRAVTIDLDDLEQIGQNIRAFKNELYRQVEDECGTLTELSERTGIPLPSLSRFFNSGSKPRLATMLKIKEALDIDEVQVAWEDFETGEGGE